MSKISSSVITIVECKKVENQSCIHDIKIKNEQEVSNIFQTTLNGVKI